MAEDLKKVNLEAEKNEKRELDDEDLDQVSGGKMVAKKLDDLNTK